MKDVPEKCPSPQALDAACPCEGPHNHLHKLWDKPGITLSVIPAKIFANWLAELTNLVNFTDREVMQMRVSILVVTTSTRMSTPSP